MTSMAILFTSTMNSSILQLLSTDFFLYALLAGLAIAVIAGPLGSFIVWRRMSYFGDTLAHSALLGIAMGLIMDINLQLSIIISSMIFALMLSFLGRNKTMSIDTLLGILAHSTLAIGVVVLALSGSVRVNLEAYLFGELLTISTTDLIWILITSSAVAIVLLRFWNQLLSATIHEELAEVEGLAVKKLNLLLMLLIAVTIAVAMKIVGVLLITSLLIIPPAAARQLSKTPEQMAVRASIIAALSVILGLFLAFYLDAPAGPSIVVLASLIFLLLFFLPINQEN